MRWLRCTGLALLPSPPSPGERRTGGLRKNWKTTLGVAVSALAFTLSPLAAQDEVSLPSDVEWSFDLVFDSAYVWRGLAFTDGAVFQPAVTVAHSNGFSVNVWGNLDVDNVNGLGGDFQEVDLTLSYAFPSDSSFNAEVGLIDYLFPGGGGETKELYFGLGWSSVVSPRLTVYYDFDEVNDFYANFSLGWSARLSSMSSLDVSASVGFAGEDFATFNGGIDSGLYDGVLSVGLAFAPNEKLSISPFVALVENLDSDALPDQAVDVHGGVALSASF